MPGGGGLQQGAGVRPHDAEHGLRRGGVKEGDGEIAAMAGHPAEVAHRRRGGGDGDVGLDPAEGVEELGVDDLAEGGHVVEADIFTDGAVFGCGILEPVLPFPRVVLGRSLAGGGEPVGALPSRIFSEHGTRGRVTSSSAS